MEGEISYKPDIKMIFSIALWSSPKATDISEGEKQARVRGGYKHQRTYFRSPYSDQTVESGVLEQRCEIYREQHGSTAS